MLTKVPEGIVRLVSGQCVTCEKVQTSMITNTTVQFWNLQSFLLWVRYTCITCKRFLNSSFTVSALINWRIQTGWLVVPFLYYSKLTRHNIMLWRSSRGVLTQCMLLIMQKSKSITKSHNNIIIY